MGREHTHTAHAKPYSAASGFVKKFTRGRLHQAANYQSYEYKHISPLNTLNELEFHL